MRILGMDFGHASLKGVEIESAFGRYEIVGYYEIPLEAQGHSAAIQKLLQELTQIPDKIISSIPSESVTSRQFHLPTRDKKAIQAGVAFELEDELPFPMEEAVSDFAILTQNKQGTSVYAAVTLKKHLVTALSEWDSTGLSPDSITPKNWAYRALCQHLLGKIQEAPVLLLQLGEEHSSLYLHAAGAPLLLRELEWGGKHITAAIAQKFHLSMEEAEALKCNQGAVPLSDTPSESHSAENIALSECILKSLAPLQTELYRISALAQMKTQLPIEKILMTGGTSLLQNLGPWIENQWSVTVQSIFGLKLLPKSDEPNAIPSGTVQGIHTDRKSARSTLAVALALSYLGSGRVSCINFRKNEFAKLSSQKNLELHVLKKPLLKISWVVGCLFLSLMVQSAVYRGRLAQTRVQLEQSIRSFFGQVSSSALKTYMADQKALRQSVQTAWNKKEEIQKFLGAPASSPLLFLNAISAQIPKNWTVDLIQAEIEKLSSSTPPVSLEKNPPAQHVGKVSLTFLVAHTHTLEHLSQWMQQKLSPFEKTPPEPVHPPEGGAQKWKITFSGNLTQEAYAQPF